MFNHLRGKLTIVLMDAKWINQMTILFNWLNPFILWRVWRHHASNWQSNQWSEIICKCAKMQFCQISFIPIIAFPNSDIPDVQTSFVHEFSKKSENITKCEKVRESLFTFRLSIADLPSIWRFFYILAKNIKILNSSEFETR